MPDKQSPDFSLFLDILHTLEAINAPYMIIGAFAAIMYGTTRTTYDIDIVVDLGEEHIAALVAAYPPPRFYADPEQMRDSIRMGIMFNIIDTSLGDKADLVPLSMEIRYRFAFAHRIRRTIEMAGIAPFEVWCARREDVIIGKLMAWAEGQSRKHETDIYEMLVFHYLNADPTQNMNLDEDYIDAQATKLGKEVFDFWLSVKTAARAATEQML